MDQYKKELQKLQSEIMNDRHVPPFHTHTLKHTSLFHMHTLTLSQHTHKFSFTHTFTHELFHTYTFAHIPTHFHTPSHTHTLHFHTHTHTHTHTQIFEHFPHSPRKPGSDVSRPHYGVSLPRRDATLYPKYILTQETINYLKKPTFDIWHWEPNEMLCLLEHMYTELGLVAAYNINPVTLRRWLVRDAR